MQCYDVCEVISIQLWCLWLQRAAARSSCIRQHHTTVELAREWMCQVQRRELRQVSEGAVDVAVRRSSNRHHWVGGQQTVQHLPLAVVLPHYSMVSLHCCYMSGVCNSGYPYSLGSWGDGCFCLWFACNTWRFINVCFDFVCVKSDILLAAKCGD